VTPKAPDSVSFESPAARPPVGPTTRMECSVCWYVYDPSEGDVVWQIPAGTPFTDLPPHWTCPNCTAARDKFLVVPGE
jgi:rubredoxin